MTLRAAWAAVVLSVLPGCEAGEVGRAASGPDFADIELSFEGCACFEEVRELKLIARRLFGIVPEIDEARQVLRLRLPKPRTLPLLEFVRSVDGTHAVTRSLTLEGLFALQGDRAVLQPTGQTIDLEPGSGPGPGESRRRLKAVEWHLTFRMKVLPE